MAKSCISCFYKTSQSKATRVYHYEYYDSDQQRCLTILKYNYWNQPKLNGKLNKPL